MEKRRGRKKSAIALHSERHSDASALPVGVQIEFLNDKLWIK